MRKSIVIGLLLLLLAGCAARRGPAEVYSAPPGLEEDHVSTIQTEPISIAQQMEGQTDIVQVVVTDERFEPAQLTTTEGERVKIHLLNKGTREHTLTLPRWGIFSRNLAPGEENYIEFTASEKGVWPFFSDAPGQEEPGLAGELKVE